MKPSVDDGVYDNMPPSFLDGKPKPFVLCLLQTRIILLANSYERRLNEISIIRFSIKRQVSFDDPSFRWIAHGTLKVQTVVRLEFEDTRS